MAKIKYSALVSDMRNKLNGSVMSKNRYGSYVRNKVTPVNPQTSYQQMARQRLGNLASSFRGLTQAQINGWNASGVNFPFTDIFGDVKQLSGQTLFIKLNNNLEKIGEARIDDAPAAGAIPSIDITASSFTVTDSALVAAYITISPAAIPAGFALAVYATPPIPPGQSFVKNRYRYVGIAGVPVAGVVDLVDQLTDRFGTYVEGERIFVRVALVSTTTGQQGVPVEVVSPITAAV